MFWLYGFLTRLSWHYFAASPAFLLEAAETRTLVVPSVFLSWTGHVLDKKTPLLRSQKALNETAIKLQKLLGNRMAKRARVYVGPEQEYFLFSKDLVETRPDMKICDRTLFGAPPAKGQQMDDLDVVQANHSGIYRIQFPVVATH